MPLAGVALLAAGAAVLVHRQVTEVSKPKSVEVQPSNSDASKHNTDEMAEEFSSVASPSADISNGVQMLEGTSSFEKDRRGQNERSRLIQPEGTGDNSRHENGGGIESTSGDLDREPADPFNVSPVVDARCGIRTPTASEECKAVQQLLLQFADERRDASWATEVESRLRPVLLSHLPNASVRGLECRTSICAVEVASPSGYLEIFSESEQRSLGLYDNSHFVSATEYGDFGDRKTITLRLFERRAP